ncbi:MAG: cyclic pyranopterin monophosphate synthase MoaC [Treponema sp.]|jgi:cyclic pyranopterin phosphate synthase|nr:cyclic pyranopterin monophosphate synthase MoaC [Treponema sp.]
MNNEKELNHFDEAGNAVMVDVSQKAVTHRTAVATGDIRVSDDILEKILAGTMKKGDVLGVARIGGITAAKQTGFLIPLCHPLPLDKCSIDFEPISGQNIVRATCTVISDGRTGVEMEALTGVSVALLSIYDMCKAVDKGMIIENIHLLEKTGGKSGDFHFNGNN